MNDLLNEPQRRRLTCTLRIIERHLRQVNAWLQITEEPGILYRRILPLSSERRTEARHCVTAALEQISELASMFNLVCQDENLLATIDAMMGLDHCDVEDTYADSMKSCGAVNPHLGPVLDPPLERLSKLVLSLSDIVTGRHG